MGDKPYERCHQPHIKDAKDAIEVRQGGAMMSNEAVRGMIHIVEQFLRRKKLICYGGTAINNILPKRLQFYDTDLELPDYDFFSPDPVADAKELANIYAKKGYPDVVATSGVHGGTFKVHVNYVPVADITFLDPRLYHAISRHTRIVDGIHYTPPVYLRMLMHLELSRPDGDISRWDKVASRLALLNSVFPMKEPGCTARVRDRLDRQYLDLVDSLPGLMPKLRDFLAERKVVFCGSFAAKEINYELKKKRVPLVTGPVPLIVLAKEPKEIAKDLKRRIAAERFKAEYEEIPAIGEIVPDHYAVHAGGKLVAIVFEALECHAMNEIRVDGIDYRIGTIDTLLTLFLPFIFVASKVLDYDTIVCYCNDLAEVADRCNPAERGALARFNTDCYGDQTTLADIRRAKNRRFKRIQGKRDKKSKDEREYYFMRYEPTAPRNKPLKMEVSTQTAGKKPKTSKLTRKGHKHSHNGRKSKTRKNKH